MVQKKRVNTAYAKAIRKHAPFSKTKIQNDLVEIRKGRNALNTILEMELLMVLASH